MRTPPVPKYKREVDELERVYKSALTQVVQMLVATSPEELIKRDIYEGLIRQLTFIVNDVNNESRQWIEKTLTDAFGHAQASTLVSMGLADSLLEAKGSLQFSLLSRQRIEAMIDDTFEDVLKATSKMSNDMKKLIRETQAEVLRTNIALQRGTITSARDLRTALVGKGFSKSLVEEQWKGIVDAGGKRWDLTTYTKMVARTKLQQAQIEGATMMALENDSDLAIISSHGATDSCRFFEGIIISLTGRTKGYSTLADVRGSGLMFHPNCQHSVHPIGDIDALPQTLKNKAGNQQIRADHAMRNPKDYRGYDSEGRYILKKEKEQKIKDKRNAALQKARDARKKSRMTFNYVEAKSIREANQWAKDNLPVKRVDYKGYDLKLANGMNQKFEELSLEYPEVANSVRFLGTGQERNRIAKEAYVEQEMNRQRGLQSYKDHVAQFGKVAVERDYLKVIKQRANKRFGSIDSNVFAQATNKAWGDASGVTFNKVWAEDYDNLSRTYARTVQSNFHPKGTEDPVSIVTHEFAHMIDYFLEDKGLRGEYMGIVNEALSKDKQWFTDNLSIYASTNDREVIAEAFAEYKHSPNPRPYAMKLGKAIEKAYQKYERGK